MNTLNLSLKTTLALIIKEKITLTIVALFCSNSLPAQMVLQYEIPTVNTFIALPFSDTVNVRVDWGDGTSDTVTDPGATLHKYNSAGSRVVTISGKLTHFGMTAFQAPGIQLISHIVGWDSIGLTSLNNAFAGASTLISVPKNLPKGVTDVGGIFSGAVSFNQDISSWNTANVTDLSGVFSGATSFNQPIGTWNTANVTNMNRMFNGATSFNQPIGNWNTTKVTNMGAMFSNASSFNQPIDLWNTSNVENMYYMFSQATSFNQPIYNWNTSKVRSMEGMFYYATSFNQPLGSWRITEVMDMASMFEGDRLCTVNYDDLLNGWAEQDIMSNVLFDGGNSLFSLASLPSRETLVNKGWTITDQGIGKINPNCMITGIEDFLLNSTNQNIEIYPNPSTGSVTITANEALGMLSIYNSVGEVVYQINTNENKVEYSSSEKGMYVVKVGNRTGKLIME